MAAVGGHARRREEDRARDGDAAWGMRSGTRLANRKPMGDRGRRCWWQRGRVCDLGISCCLGPAMHIGTGTYVRARFW